REAFLGKHFWGPTPPPHLNRSFHAPSRSCNPARCCTHSYQLSHAHTHTHTYMHTCIYLHSDTYINCLFYLAPTVYVNRHCETREKNFSQNNKKSTPLLGGGA